MRCWIFPAAISNRRRASAVKADLLHGIGKVHGRFILLLNVQHVVSTLHLQEFVAQID
jgi:purine-binding chemotaxis protein CheW